MKATSTFPAPEGCRQGVLAFGDSITNGGGELQWGVALQSWAMWTARGLGLPFTNYAVDGAQVTDVLAQQVPAFLECNAAADARYQLGCLFIGANDVRQLGFDAETFASRYRQAIGFLHARAERVLTVTTPLDLGRPRAGAKVAVLNAAIRSVAADTGTLVVDLDRLRARNLVMFDHVHLTAFGQVALAERALDVLERDGMQVMVRPRALIRYETTPVGRLRSDLTYVYRHAKLSARGLAWTIGARLTER